VNLDALFSDMDAAGTTPFPIRDAVAAVFRIGSHSHGTHIPPEDEHGIDDLDLMVIVIPPARNRLGLTRYEHSSYKVGHWDVVVYDWSKYIGLLMKQNPNVVGTLWLEPEDVLYSSPEFEEVQRMRQYLMSQQLHPSFIGYARGQMHKMRHHASQGYMGEKRKRLVERHGYDCKNAAHLLRLLYMAVETLKTGTMKVRRPETEATFLKDVKRGRFDLETIENVAAAMFAAADDALRTTPLRHEPNAFLADRLIVDGYLNHWRPL
jgi:predicted nucleotidyltransferase